jgi:flagellar hook-associated protein 2
MADITPSSMAAQLATSYTARAQSLLTAQSKQAQATGTALNKLQTALAAFDSALGALSTSSTKSLVQRTATFSTTGYASATANAMAQPGNYALFVEQVATTHQVAFEDLPAVPVSLGGPLVVQLADGTNFTVNLTSADMNGDGTISQAEIARAINQADENKGKVTASTVTTGGTTQLVLTSGQSGLKGRITLDASGLPSSPLKTALSSGGNDLIAASDAVVWFGQPVTGIRLQQGSNTVTAIDGISITLTKAMQTGDAPLSLTVASDNAGTSANVQKFVDAYNALKKSLDELTANGNESTSRAAFASDSGVRALRDRLSLILRQSYGGQTLAQFGISANRNGVLTLDSEKLQKAVAAQPDGLDTLFGNTGITTASGALGAFHSAVKNWTDVSSGHLKQRKTSLETQQKSLTARQARLDAQYDTAYTRYLNQFSQLQKLQSLMSDNSNLLSHLGTT